MPIGIVKDIGEFKLNHYEVKKTIRNGRYYKYLILIINININKYYKL